ncbi:hypothetical protein CHLNCDRAFT_143321 [Chlorella variabilis]|uniref:Ribosome biogenesis protein NSA1 n=1 Tax=Chlorella variabilis TaxID=554065 RepID=E1Z9Z0_CHLVA|nr:hypothetical protein CHLNCDRAFT_143321 [Chlorella variabilis]EFN57603.1 hypothetical protein CHLNCDRAFT_143321 [Chlorella variabilis]|eukprot:XP_005849705.1 hypothetical protein CHLNCDRAFT_143321 [Chlorella variabilis]
MAADKRDPPLRLVCSDELGQLKVVQTADGDQLGTAAVASTWGQPFKLQWIDCIALGSASGIGDTASAVLAVARCSGSIELLSPLAGELLGTIPATPITAAGSGSAPQQQQDAVRVRGLHLLWGAGGSGSGSNGGGAEGPPPLPSVLSVTEGGTASVHAPAAGSRGSWEQQASWQVPAGVCCTAYDPATGRLAVGCQGTELRLYDCASGDLVFAFKGGKPNSVGLVDRPWNTAIVFLPPLASTDSSGGSDGGPGDRLLVGTGYQKVRLYDKAKGKRPQMELAWGEGRVTCMALEPQSHRVWLGNGLGQIEVLDVVSRRFSGAVKGLAGGVRALAVHPTQPVLASVGLDRYLRLHATHSRRLLAKVYCKTLPTDASMLPPIEQQQERKQRRRKGAASSEDDDDEEEADEKQERAPQRKHSKHRGAGGSKRQRDNRRRQQGAGGEARSN